MKVIHSKPDATPFLNQPAQGPHNGGRHQRHRQYLVYSGKLELLQQPYSGGQLQRPEQNKMLYTFVEIVFSIKPLWEAAKQKARSKIADRGSAIGLNMAAEVATLKAAVPSWEEELEAVQNNTVDYPDYYTKPFHAYNDGNLCWEAAFQVPSAAKLVHAPVMDPANKALDPRGDAKLRASYSSKLKQIMQQIGSRAVKDVVDFGCATGLSTLELQRNFPDARITALDLSPHFLAVARVLQRQRQEAGSIEHIEFLHAAAEATDLASNSADLVSTCLVIHELPTRATEAILEEAFKLLRSGGTLGIMEMDPKSERFTRILGNPFAYVPFKATEPWLMEYIATDLLGLLSHVGFASIVQEPSTPGHFTIVSQKP